MHLQKSDFGEPCHILSMGSHGVRTAGLLRERNEIGPLPQIDKHGFKVKHYLK